MQVFSYLVVIKFALMIRYTSQHQIELFEFEHPFEVEPDKNNRWVKLSKLLLQINDLLLESIIFLFQYVYCFFDISKKRLKTNELKVNIKELLTN